MSKLDQLFSRTLIGVTDADLDALSAELEPRTGCAISREGFDDYSLTWIRWVWTPTGYVPDPAGQIDHWPLSGNNTVASVFELAIHLRRLRRQ